MQKTATTLNKSFQIRTMQVEEYKKQDLHNMKKKFKNLQKILIGKKINIDDSITTRKQSSTERMRQSRMQSYSHKPNYKNLEYQTIVQNNENYLFSDTKPIRHNTDLQNRLKTLRLSSTLFKKQFKNTTSNNQHTISSVPSAYDMSTIFDHPILNERYDNLEQKFDKQIKYKSINQTVLKHIERLGLQEQQKDVPFFEKKSLNCSLLYVEKLINVLKKTRMTQDHIQVSDTDIIMKNTSAFHQSLNVTAGYCNDIMKKCSHLNKDIKYINNVYQSKHRKIHSEFDQIDNDFQDAQYNVFLLNEETEI